MIDSHPLVSFFVQSPPEQNLVKKRWEPGEDEGPESAKERPMSQEDKDAVKASILNLMCAVPSDVQKQLSEALAIISQHDFPGAWGNIYKCRIDARQNPAHPLPILDSTPAIEKWQNLLPDMVAKFGSRDLHIINGVLRSANAILKRFRCVLRWNVGAKACFTCFS